MTRLRLAAVVLLLLSPAFASAQLNSPAESEAIDHLRRAIASNKNIELKASIETRMTSGSSAGDRPIIGNTLLSVKRFGQRAIISMKSKTDRPGFEAAAIQNDYIVYDNGDVLSCQASLDLSLRQVDGITDDLGFLLYSERLAGKQRFDKHSVYSVLNDAGAALWIIGYTPLIDYVDGASELVVTPTDDGADVHAVSEYGVLKLALSRSHNWLPRSFRITKDRNDKVFGGNIGNLYPKSGSDAAANEVESVTWSGEVESFTNDKAGQWAPKRLAVLRQAASKAGPVMSINTRIDLEQLVYDPSLTESDFVTDIVAPVDFPVTVNEAPQLPYKWDGTAPVPGVPELTERPIQSLAASGSRKRIVFIVLNVAVILIIILLLWRKRAAV